MDLIWIMYFCLTLVLAQDDKVTGSKGTVNDNLIAPAQDTTTVREPEPERSCTAEILAAFWGSVGMFILLAGAAVIMYRNRMLTSIGKRRKKGLDTLFDDTSSPMRPPSRAHRESMLSGYADVMSIDTACHYRRVSRSLGSINFRTFRASTVKGSTLYNTKRSKMSTNAAVDITISVEPPQFKIYDQQSYWLGTETDFEDVYKSSPKKRATLRRYYAGLQEDTRTDKDEEDTASEEPRGATGTQTHCASRDVRSKFLYISPVFNEKNAESKT
ncbi:uncharacterized protein LOC124111908 isoform X2 [Haliotis rufescens]|nr:uncharacterized protein LOC124111908 isoform X2 [Haliotis rufescens]XP_048255800.1 uncharacterized protein LOC124111908 isoform X2 [Haliotis rufescens]